MLLPALLSDAFQEIFVSELNVILNFKSKTRFQSEDVNVKFKDVEAVWKVSLEMMSSNTIQFVFEIDQLSNRRKENTFKIEVSLDGGLVLYTSVDYFLTTNTSKIAQDVSLMPTKRMLKFSVSFCTRDKMIDTTDVCKNILQNNINMLNDPRYSDFTFIVNGKEFKVHKNILAAASPFFANLFDSNMKESRKNKCVVHTIDASVFRHMLNFIYGGILPTDIKHIAIGLYGAAHYYQLEDLMNICKSVIRSNLSPANAQEVYVCALLYDMKDLREDAQRIGSIIESSAPAAEFVRQAIVRKKTEISVLEDLEKLANKLVNKN